MDKVKSSKTKREAWDERILETLKQIQDMASRIERQQERIMTGIEVLRSRSDDLEGRVKRLEHPTAIRQPGGPLPGY